MQIDLQEQRNLRGNEVVFLDELNVHHDLTLD